MKPSNSKSLGAQIVTYTGIVSSFVNVNIFCALNVSVDRGYVSYVRVKNDPKLSRFLRISRHDFD